MSASEPIVAELFQLKRICVNEEGDVVGFMLREGFWSAKLGDKAFHVHRRHNTPDTKEDDVEMTVSLTGRPEDHRATLFCQACGLRILIPDLFNEERLRNLFSDRIPSPPDHRNIG